MWWCFPRICPEHTPSHHVYSCVKHFLLRCVAECCTRTRVGGSAWPTRVLPHSTPWSSVCVPHAISGGPTDTKVAHATGYVQICRLRDEGNAPYTIEHRRRAGGARRRRGGVAQ
eukprot:gene11994-biopygen13981